MTDRELTLIAVNASKNAYAPYSKFKVGAALLGKSGKVYTGCNIEDASFSPTVCAERVAIFKAVSEGERTFRKIAVAGGTFDGNCFPCGVCRQVMSEFFNGETEVLIAKGENGDFIKTTLAEILPFGFKL